MLYYFFSQDLCKYIRGEMKLDQEIITIQSIIAYGIEREELRDEIFVQCMRQATNNPNTEWAERVWLLLCLAIVAFQPSKLLYKYFVSFLRKNLQVTRQRPSAQLRGIDSYRGVGQTPQSLHLG